MKKCIVCGSNLEEPAILTLDNMPSSAQNIPSLEELKDDKGITLHLYKCGICGLVQFDCEPVFYYKDVIRAGGFSTTMAELRRQQYMHFIRTYHLENKKIIEVGCGRGEFLKILTEFPVEAFGIEHKKDFVDIAVAEGLNVWEAYADNSNQGWKSGPYDAFLSFNFLEHQPDPNEMLKSIYNNLADDGMGLITVPSLEYILENNGYYELIRDHIAYYTFESLRFLMDKNNFEIIEQGIINRDTIFVIVRKKCPISFSGLAASYNAINQEVDQFVDQLKREESSLAIWGASHQGFTLAATTILKEYAECIVDSAPFKQGKYAPTSHLPIVSPDRLINQPVGSILIVAPGYTDEIRDVIRQKLKLKASVYTLRSNHIERL